MSKASRYVCTTEELPRVLLALESVQMPVVEAPDALTVRDLFSHPAVVAKCNALRAAGARVDQIIDLLREIGIVGSRHQLAMGIRHATKVSKGDAGRPKRSTKGASAARRAASSDAPKPARSRALGSDSPDDTNPGRSTAPDAVDHGPVSESRTVRPKPPVNPARIPVATSVALRDRDL